MKFFKYKCPFIIHHVVGYGDVTFCKEPLRAGIKSMPCMHKHRHKTCECEHAIIKVKKFTKIVANDNIEYIFEVAASPNDTIGRPSDVYRKALHDIKAWVTDPVLKSMITPYGADENFALRYSKTSIDDCANQIIAAYKGDVERFVRGAYNYLCALAVQCDPCPFASLRGAMVKVIPWRRKGKLHIRTKLMYTETNRRKKKKYHTHIEIQ